MKPFSRTRPGRPGRLALAFVLTLGSSVVACGGGGATFPDEDASSADGQTAGDAHGDDDAHVGTDAGGNDATMPPDAGGPDDSGPSGTDAGNDGGGQADTGPSDDTGAPPVDAGTDTGSSHDSGFDVDAADSAPPNGTDAAADSGRDASGGADDAGNGGTDAASDDAGMGGGSEEGGGSNDGSLGSGDGNVGDAGTIAFVAGVQVWTIAGSSVAGTQDGNGANAQFNNPTGMAIDQHGNLVVTDYNSSRVRLVTSQGDVSTIAAAPLFTGPFAAVVATDGSYYVETDYNAVGVKTATSGTLWRIAVVADGGISAPVLLAQGFGRPRGLAPVAGGDLFVTDRTQEIMQTVSATLGTTTFVAGDLNTAGFQNGTGTSAEFSSPIGVATLLDGSFVVADSENNLIRRIEADGTVTTFAGTGSPGVNDGPLMAASFNTPRDVAVDAAGNVYVSDGGNHRIRRIRIDGNVDTLAGDGTAGFNDGPGSTAEFYGQEGIDVAPDGHTVYLSDGNSGDGSAYNRVRGISIP